MKNKLGIIALSLALVSSLFSQKKEEERITNSTNVLGEIQVGNMPMSILNQTICVAVIPSAKRFGIGFGARVDFKQSFRRGI